MRSSGKDIKNKRRTNLCYSGHIPSYEEFVDILVKMFKKRTRDDYNPLNADFTLRKYNILLEDIKKPYFRNYKKSSYNFLVNSGLYVRTKLTQPRFKK